MAPAALMPHLDEPVASTKERILRVAENLFAEHGFAATSLRQLTSEAAVNLAAVHYHFGSKEQLVTEVFRRRMDEMSRMRLDLLDQARAADDASLEAILRAFVEPALALSLDQGDGAAFMRMLARAYAERNEPLRQFLADNYGHVLREFSAALAACLPGLEQEKLYWRLDFLAGALTYTMADFGLLEHDNTTHRERCRRITGELVRFAAAGFRS